MLDFKDIPTLLSSCIKFPFLGNHWPMLHKGGESSRREQGSEGCRYNRDSPLGDNFFGLGLFSNCYGDKDDVLSSVAASS